MIYRITRSKDNSRIIQDIDPVFPEFFGLDPAKIAQDYQFYTERFSALL